MKKIEFVFVMTNPLSNIRGSLKDIKADFARHAGIKLQYVAGRANYVAGRANYVAGRANW